MDRCLKCKGRGYCNRPFCSIQTKAQALFKIRDNIRDMSEGFTGSAPSVFVGRQGYPAVNVGILSPSKIDESAWRLDAPRQWSAENLDIRSIIGFRSSLINSRIRESIRSSSRFIDIAKEVSLAKNHVDLDIKLISRPYFKTSFDAQAPPTGPLAKLKSATIIGNPKIPQKVDKVVSDTDMFASKAIGYLYSKGFDENTITRIFSMGNMGIGKNRKIVPTRWSITAVDDQLGKQRIDAIRNSPNTENLAYFGAHLGNYFLVLFVDDIWGYELFEMYMPKVGWNTSKSIQYTTDHEFYSGRDSYADNCAGGYYAARLAILDKLDAIKRQSTAIVLRFITDEYAVPLGVWVVREAVRKTLKTRPIEFSSTELMLRYAKLLISRKFGYDISDILKKSVLLNEKNTQKKLADF